MPRLSPCVCAQAGLAAAGAELQRQQPRLPPPKQRRARVAEAAAEAALLARAEAAEAAVAAAATERKRAVEAVRAGAARERADLEQAAHLAVTSAMQACTCNI